MTLPERGLPADEVSARLEAFRDGDAPWRDGRMFAMAFDAGPEVRAVAERAYLAYLTESGLDPTAFRSLPRMEADLVAVAAGHLGSGDGAEVVGNFTSGGTESIFLAVKAARDRARSRGVDRPTLVHPVTAHAAFQKAAQYLDLQLVPVRVDPATQAADPAAVAAAVTDRTALVVGSAVTYAHGVIDPIPALAEIARARDVWLHVDACMGGWMLPLFRAFGDDVPPFAFDVPGVCSVSVDLHKYAFAPKGASLILYRRPELRQLATTIVTTWAGYPLINPTVQSSRSGGPIAAAWAVVHHLGRDGYLAIAADLRRGTRALIDGIAAIDGLRVLGRPSMNVLSFTADGVCPFAVHDRLEARGWGLHPQFAYEGTEPGLHLTVMPANIPHIPAFLADLREAVASARAAPRDDRPLDLRIQEAAQAIATDGIPERLGPINAMLNALPPDARRQILAAFLDQLFGGAPRSDRDVAPAGTTR